MSSPKIRRGDPPQKIPSLLLYRKPAEWWLRWRNFQEVHQQVAKRQENGLYSLVDETCFRRQSLLGKYWHYGFNFKYSKGIPTILARDLSLEKALQVVAAFDEAAQEKVDRKEYAGTVQDFSVFPDRFSYPLAAFEGAKWLWRRGRNAPYPA